MSNAQKQRKDWYRKHPLRSTESVYKKLQNTMHILNGATYRKMSLVEYNDRYPNVPVPLLESFTAIQGFENGVRFRYLRKLKSQLFDTDCEFQDKINVFWIADGYIHKQKMYVDEVVKMAGDEGDYVTLIMRYSNLTNSRIIRGIDAYSMEFMFKHANRSNMKAIKDLTNPKAISLYRKLRVQDIL
jgi:hypothetical protein